MNRIMMRRNIIINKIVSTFVKLDGDEYDKNSLLLMICSEYDCSMRAAKEYFDIAEIKFNQRSSKP